MNQDETPELEPHELEELRYFPIATERAKDRVNALVFYAFGVSLASLMLAAAAWVIVRLV